MTVYWECNGDTYPFDSNKRYLIYYKGCFCPPHRGHFNTVKQFTDIGNNIHVMVHQIGSERRHGVPYYLNREVWRTYIDRLLPVDRVHLVKYNYCDELLDLPILNHIDTVVFIRGNEGYDTSYSNKIVHKFSYIINKLNSRGINMDFYYLERPLVDTLCATQFVKTLVKTKKKCCHEGDICKYNRLKYYYPDDLDKNDMVNITRKLQLQYLRY